MCSERGIGNCLFSVSEINSSEYDWWWHLSKQIWPSSSQQELTWPFTNIPLRHWWFLVYSTHNQMLSWARYVWELSRVSQSMSSTFSARLHYRCSTFSNKHSIFLFFICWVPVTPVHCLHHFWMSRLLCFLQWQQSQCQGRLCLLFYAEENTITMTWKISWENLSDVSFPLVSFLEPVPRIRGIL